MELSPKPTSCSRSARVSIPSRPCPATALDYWPKTAKVIQVDFNPDRIGLTKPVAVGICGDAKLVARAILTNSRPPPATRGARSARR